MRYYILFLILIFLLFPIQLNAQQQDCLSCHNNWYSEKIDETSIHSPFLQDRCKVCHSEDDMNTLTQNNINNSYNWILSKDLLNGINLIPVTQADNLLIQVAHDNTSYKTFHINFNNIVPATDINFSEPIIITNFHVVSITSDYMTHVKLVWSTNIPTKCTLYYKTLNDKNKLTDYIYSTNHIAELDGLKNNVKYYVYIVATSPFNESVTSTTLSFNTSMRFNNSLMYSNYTDKKLIKVKLVNLNGKRYIEVINSVPIYLKIAKDNSYIAKSKDIFIDNDNNINTNIKSCHLYASEIYELGYTKCLRCHNSSQYNHNSHPINIVLPKNMHPPKELILVNGRITCITCHCPHASNYPHQLRMEETTLCGCCHNLKQYAGLKIAQQYQFKGIKNSFYGKM